MLTHNEAVAIASEWPLDHTLDDCLTFAVAEYTTARRFNNDRATHEAIRDYRSLVLLGRYLEAAGV